MLTNQSTHDIIYSEIKKIENLEEFKMFTIAMEIINYTMDKVYYYEGWENIEGQLEKLQAENPTHEIGVSYFTINNVNIPYNEENIEFINSHADDEISAVVKFYDYEYSGHAESLQDVAEYMEDRVCVTYHLGRDENEAFEEYCEEMGLLLDVPDHMAQYIDFEKMLRDYKCDGMGVYEIPCNHPTLRRYMFCN